MITVRPGATFETSIDWGVSGLAGTIRVRLLNGSGGTAIAATTSGIVEFPATSGRYEVTLTAPGTAGQYQVFWDDGSVAVGHTAPGDDVLVTSDDPAAAGGTSNLYVSVADLKEILRQEGETYQDLALEIAVSSASRACDSYKRKRGVGFYPTVATRYFTADPASSCLSVNDVVSVSSLTVDRDGDGVYEETWTEGEEFYLGPLNATADGRPFNTIHLYPQASTSFPRYPSAMKVAGTFGWAETPIEVRQAAILLARDLLKRTVDQPLDVLIAASNEAVTTAHLGSFNKAAAALLDLIDPPKSLASLQLG